MLCSGAPDSAAAAIHRTIAPPAAGAALSRAAQAVTQAATRSKFLPTRARGGPHALSQDRALSLSKTI